MVIIRLSRTGTNKRPFYHVVVADHRFSRDGRYLERVGFYNPIANGQEVQLRLEKERINYWVANGAQTTERVRDLIETFDKTGIQTGAEIAAKPLSAKDQKKASAKASKKQKAAEAGTEQPAGSE